MNPTLNYFEYKIISTGVNCAIGIGVGESEYPLNRMPGWNRSGVGYHADDGKLFYQHGCGVKFGPTCTAGDRMGCGVDFETEDYSNSINVFFTKNGQQVGSHVKIKKPTNGLYPLVGLHTQGAQVQYLGNWHYSPKGILPYSWKYWREFGGWAPNGHCKNIGGFKFGGSVRDRHTYVCKYEILANFNLAVADGPPNHQI